MRPTYCNYCGAIGEALFILRACINKDYADGGPVEIWICCNCGTAKEIEVN